MVKSFISILKLKSINYIIVGIVTSKGRKRGCYKVTDTLIEEGGEFLWLTIKTSYFTNKFNLLKCSVSRIRIKNDDLSLLTRYDDPSVKHLFDFVFYPNDDYSSILFIKRRLGCLYKSMQSMPLERGLERIK